MSDYPSSPVFAVGILAQRAEHRSTDIAGRPVDPLTEGDTARSERIRQLQDRWQPRAFPSAEPIDIMTEWLAQSPENRMSAFARKLAENPDLLPTAETEPHAGQRPRPGGLLEQLASQDRPAGCLGGQEREPVAMTEPAPYPPEPRGTKFRRIPFPVASPDRTPKPMTVKRKDGTECDLMATVGAARRGPVSPDELVHDWTPVL